MKNDIILDKLNDIFKELQKINEKSNINYAVKLAKKNLRNEFIDELYRNSIFERQANTNFKKFMSITKQYLFVQKYENNIDGINKINTEANKILKKWYTKDELDVYNLWFKGWF